LSTVQIFAFVIIKSAAGFDWAREVVDRTSSNNAGHRTVLVKRFALLVRTTKNSFE
jgi:hypothetical protein